MLDIESSAIQWLRRTVSGNADMLYLDMDPGF